VVEDRETGRSRGFGFVEMSTKEEGAAVIAQFNDEEVNSCALTVNEAKPRENRGGGDDRSFGYVRLIVEKVITDDKEHGLRLMPVLAEISKSRRRARKTQREIERLKKKTQAIIDKLP
jgi:RNA recognition motif-containing protein